MEPLVFNNDIPLLETRQDLNGQKSSMYVERAHSRSDNSISSVFGGNKKRSYTSRSLSFVKSRRHALLRLLVHIPAISASLGLLSLTFVHVFWGPPSSRTNTILNALQFVAQLHASLILLSLSAMLLHLVHHGLNRKQGIPLGFLSSAFQLASLSYIFKSDFTSLATEKRNRHLRHVFLFIGFLALGLLAGPSSAITIIPRLQFWAVQNIYPGDAVQFSVYINANESTLYPATLTSDIMPSYCTASNATLASDCPSAGIRNFMMDDTLFVMDADSAQPSLNLTVDGPGWNRYLVGTDAGSYQYMQSAYTASTLSGFLGKVLSGYEAALTSFRVPEKQNVETIMYSDSDALLPRYDLSLKVEGKEIATQKPLVEVECTGYPTDSSSITFQHDQMIWPPWSSDPVYSTVWEVPSSQYSDIVVDDGASSPVNFTFVNIDQFDSSAKPSLLTVFSTPMTYYSTGCEIDCPNYNYSIYGCTVDARWMPTRAFYDSSSGYAGIFDSRPDPNGPLLSSIYDTGPNVAANPQLYISNSWASLLNTPYYEGTITPTKTNTTVLQALGQKCVDSNTFLNSTINGISLPINNSRTTNSPMLMLQCLQVSLSVYLSDALSRLQLSLPVYFVAHGTVSLPTNSYSGKDSLEIYDVQNLYDSDAWNYIASTNGTGLIQNLTASDFADSSRFTKIHMPMSRWGYGYGFQDSILVYVGTAILLIHVMICILYMGWLLGTEAGREGDAGWKSIGELVVLAVRSGAVAVAGEEQRGGGGGSSSTRRDRRVSVGGYEEDQEEGDGMGKKDLVDWKWTDCIVMEEIKGRCEGEVGRRQTILRRVKDSKGRTGDDVEL